MANGVASGPRHVLLVVGTGIQWGGQMTLAAQNAIRAADRVLFAVTEPWGVRWLRQLNPKAESLPYPRDGRPRREIYDAMTRRILDALDASERVCAAFYGSPTFLVRAGHDAVIAARRVGHSARMLPGISSVECLAADLEIDFGETGYQLVEANEFLRRPRPIDRGSFLILCQIALIGQRSAFDEDRTRVRRGLERLSERLRARYGLRHRVLIYEAAVHPLAAPKIVEVELGELADVEVSEVSTLCVPPVGRAAFERRLSSSFSIPTGPHVPPSLAREPAFSSH